MAAAGVARQQDILFASVFPHPDHTTPTPEATPDIGVLSSPGQSFGGFNTPSNATEEAVQTAKAWSTATRYLSFPSTPEWQKPHSQDVQAFDLLLNSPEKTLRLAEWHMNQIATHYRQSVLPSLQAWQTKVAVSTANELINSTVQLLQTCQTHYLQPLQLLASVVRRNAQKTKIGLLRAQVVERWHSLVLHSLPRQRLAKTLASALYQHMEISLETNSNPEKCLKNRECSCKLDFDTLPLSLLNEIGLGGDLAERALAHATHRLLNGPAVERRCFQVDWSGRQTVVPRLRTWVEETFSPTLQGAIGLLTGTDFIFSTNDRQQMAHNAVSNLVSKRTDALFDYIKLWPDSMGALLDIKDHISSGSTFDKASLCAAFVRQVQHRLLHAGATTAEVLSIYVNVIHAFRLLDARGVLLEKVAVPIRNYLRSRDDSVGIIAASFLAEIDEEGNLKEGDERVCVDIARVVESSSLEDTRDQRTLNWDDMDWVPEPIDAGPNHKFTKSEDVLSYILGLFDQEDFIKEVTNVLAQHLLQATDPEFAKETRLVELFKSRFDPSKLQAAEVMLKDMRDSVMLEKRIFSDRSRDPVPTPRDIQVAIPSEGITLNSLYQRFEGRISQVQFIASLRLVANRRNDLYFPKRSRQPLEPSSASSKKPNDQVDISLRILSNFFWPQLRSNKFSLPAEFAPLIEQAQSLFTRYSGQRTLDWQNALARMSVTLELEDRTVVENDIPAWRATVINAFASERADNFPSRTECDYNAEEGLTPLYLQETLDMEPELVSDALSYWTAKRVLYQREPDHYFVLESLDMDTGVSDTARQGGGAGEDAFSAVKSQDAMLRENAPVFEAFIANMLRNGGAKEVGGMMGITGMLKMVLPTFTYGEEETRLLLGEMEARGEVVKNGDSWSIA